MTNEIPLNEWLAFRTLQGLQAHGQESPQVLYNIAKDLAMAAHIERKGQKPDREHLWVILQAAIAATHSTLLPRSGGQGILYTFSYTWQGGPIIEQLILLNIVITDIRYSANSRVHKWRQPSLQAWLGDYYRHIQELGNINYNQSGDIQLFKPEEGVTLVMNQLQAGQHLALMCVCTELDKCHRKTVAQKIVEQQSDVILVHL
jgi:hypothetical protein